MTIRSKRGAWREFYRIIRQCRRDLAGGLQFGMDWPTLRATFPERYARLQELNRMFAGLPD